MLNFGATNVTISAQYINGTARKFTMPLSEVQYNQYIAISASLKYGWEAGACMTMLLVMATLTNPDKRRPIFWLNIAALIINSIARLFDCTFFLTQWSEFYFFFAGDFSTISPGSYTFSIIASLLPVLVVTLILTSLWLQALAVLKDLSNPMKWRFIGFGGVLVVLAIIFRIVVAITNILSIYKTEWLFSQNLTRGFLSLTLVNIWYFSGIFTWKLVFAIWVRHKLNIKNIAPLQALAIGALCTMIIPSIFAILQMVSGYLTNFENPGSLSITLVAVFSPFSHMWSQASVFKSSPSASSGSSKRTVDKTEPLRFRDIFADPPSSRRDSDSNASNTTTIESQYTGVSRVNRSIRDPFSGLHHGYGNDLAEDSPSASPREKGDPFGIDHRNDMDLAERGIYVQRIVDVSFLVKE
ncbi:fungal pheromone mating factor STE2 GPCR-domain-containing protein [Tricladium varicosporioides]|nr:fungal pheromone mating factor STE2 GPCR-domain-containing protein [Hymenoscyphus varicosporioides]